MKKVVVALVVSVIAPVSNANALSLEEKRMTVVAGMRHGLTLVEDVQGTFTYHSWDKHHHLSGETEELHRRYVVAMKGDMFSIETQGEGTAFSPSQGRFDGDEHLLEKYDGQTAYGVNFKYPDGVSLANSTTTGAPKSWPLAGYMLSQYSLADLIEQASLADMKITEAADSEGPVWRVTMPLIGGDGLLELRPDLHFRATRVSISGSELTMIFENLFEQDPDTALPKPIRQSVEHRRGDSAEVIHRSTVETADFMYNRGLTKEYFTIDVEGMKTIDDRRDGGLSSDVRSEQETLLAEAGADIHAMLFDRPEDASNGPQNADASFIPTRTGDGEHTEPTADDNVGGSGNTRKGVLIGIGLIVLVLIVAASLAMLRTGAR